MRFEIAAPHVDDGMRVWCHHDIELGGVLCNRAPRRPICCARHAR
jgi:hypothetical protein